MTAPRRPWEDVSPRPFSTLRPTGLLWLINTSVFHPRGFALALHYPHLDAAEPDGWVLNGDGCEPWLFSQTPEGDALFRTAQDLLRPRTWT